MSKVDLVTKEFIIKHLMNNGLTYSEFERNYKHNFGGMIYSFLNNNISCLPKNKVNIVLNIMHSKKSTELNNKVKSNNPRPVLQPQFNSKVVKPPCNCGAKN